MFLFFLTQFITQIRRCRLILLPRMRRPSIFHFYFQPTGSISTGTMQLRFQYILTTCMLSVIGVLPAIAQVPRQIPAKKLLGSIRVDGKLDEPAWKEAPLASHFVAIQPVAFTP